MNDPVNFIDPWGLDVTNLTSHPIRVKLEKGDKNYITLNPGKTREGVDGVIVGDKRIKLNPGVDVTIGEVMKKIKDPACPTHIS